MTDVERQILNNQHIIMQSILSPNSRYAWERQMLDCRNDTTELLRKDYCGGEEE